MKSSLVIALQRYSNFRVSIPAKQGKSREEMLVAPSMDKFYLGMSFERRCLLEFPKIQVHRVQTNIVLKPRCSVVKMLLFLPFLYCYFDCGPGLLSFQHF